MASEIKKNSDTNINFYNYKIRISYLAQAKHLNDEFLNLGYDYEGKLLEKFTSPELRANPIQIPFYRRLESLMYFLIQNVKYIKKTFSIAHEKETLNIN